jgi:GT2 family glycosyltransferase
MMTAPAALESQPAAMVPVTLRLSVIIVNWNTCELLRACLGSLGQYLEHPDCEVIVVDNGSADESPKMVAAEFPSAKLICLPENIGFSSGNNVGMRVAAGKYILLLNSDTEVHSDALWLMCDHMEQNPRIGALGARLLNPDGSVQLSCRSFPSYRTALFHRKSLLTRLFPANRFSQQYLMTGVDHGHRMEVDWVIGACLMTRRDTVDEVGLLDEGFFMYAEDVDWCYRMRKAGWTVEYFPDAEVMHHYEKSASKAPFRMHKERHRSMWRFYRKHYSNNPVTDAATFAGISARLAFCILRDGVSSVARK